MDTKKNVNFTYNKSPIKNLFLIVNGGLFIASIIGRLSMLTLIMVAVSFFISLFIVYELIMKNEISKWNLISFATGIFGSFIFYILFGLNDAFFRFMNFLLALPTLVLFITLSAVCINYKKQFQKIICLSLAVLMLGTTILYALTMSFRMKPAIASLYEGHEDYLNTVKSAGAKSDSPNVLFILADDMGYSDISSYSYRFDKEAIVRTPNIDSLWKDGNGNVNGIAFENFYAAYPVCSPSRFAALTGRYPTRGYVDNVLFPTELSMVPYGNTRFINPFEFKRGVDGMPGDEITVAEVFDSVGYNTGCFGKWHLGDYGEYLPNAQGFDYFYGSPYVNDMTPYEFYRNEEKVISAKEMDQTKITGLLTDEITDYITSSVNKNEKFFAYYASPWPHAPVHASEEFVENSLSGTYGACIEELDASVGKIVDTLKTLGVFDDTIIVFTSDNGPGCEGATGALRGRKNTTFDGGQKVPFIVSYPNAIAGQADMITTSAMLIDIFPTLLSFSGINQLPKDRIIDGKDLSSVMNGTLPRDAKIHDILLFMKRGKVQAIQMPVTVEGKLIDFKYFERVGTENSAFLDKVYIKYLFNLDLDPAEAYNVSVNYPEIQKLMAEKLLSVQKDMKTNRRGTL